MRRAYRRFGGFTMVELVVTMIIVGVLGAIILPRLSGNATAGTTFADRIAATLLLAQKTAVTRRRLVCVTVAPRAVTLRMASSNPATNPANACRNNLWPGSQDDADAAISDASVAASSDEGLVGTTLFFLPNGDIRSGAAGGAFARGAIAVRASGQKVRTITIDGRTGHVD